MLTIVVALGLVVAVRAGDPAVGTDPVGGAESFLHGADDPVHQPHEAGPVDPPMERSPIPPPGVLLNAGPWERDGFVSIQVNVDAEGRNIPGDAANEPSIAIDPTDPGNMVIGWRQFDTVQSNFRRAGVGFTHDAGACWTFLGSLDREVFRSDPVLGADADGFFYYYSLNGDFTCQMFISGDQGESWTGPILAFGGDKQWIDIDRTGGIGHGQIYAAWDHFGCCGENVYIRSSDGGYSYTEPIPVPGFPIWGVTAVGPDGAVYVAGRRRTSSSRFVVAKSTTSRDPQQTPSFDFVTEVDLGGRLIFSSGGPNPGGLLGQVWVATDHSEAPTRGNVYVAASVAPASGDPLEFMFTRSTDGAMTFTAPRRISDDDPGDGWQWFGTLSVAPSGRLDAVWNDTRHTGSERLSELFYAYSTDAGDTWSTNVPVSPVFDSFLGWPNQDKLGDYYDMKSDDLGAHVAYAATFNNEQDVYYLRIAIDCNDNGLHDGDDIASGRSRDDDGNGVPDECEGCVRDPAWVCDGDVDGNGTVNPVDVGLVQAAFCVAGECTDDALCQYDLDCNEAVNPVDVGIVQSLFGTCDDPRETCR
jgi:hypothetical protein